MKLRHNPGEVRRFAIEVAMPLWDEGFSVLWEDREEIDATWFRIERGAYRGGFAVSDAEVLLARDRQGYARCVTQEILRKFGEACRATANGTGLTDLS